MESGGNVTFSFSGSLDTTGVAPSGQNNGTTVALDLNAGIVDQISFNRAFVAVPAAVYLGGPTGVTGFTGVEFSSVDTSIGAPASSSGDLFTLAAVGLIELSPGYVPNSPISGTMTFNGTSLAALGIDTSTTLTFSTNFGDIIFFPQMAAAGNDRPAADVVTVNMDAINSATSTGVFVPNAHADGLKSLTNTALNALHNQRIVRARSRIGNPRVASDTLASSDRHLSRYLHFAARQGMNLGQALGLEEAPVSVRIDDSLDQVAQFFSVEVPAGGKIVADKAPLEEPKRWEVYAVGDFGHHDQSALDTVNRGFQSRTWTGNVGVEYLVNDNLNVGVAYTYADNDTDLDEGLGNVDIEGNLASVYATGFFDDKYVDVLYSYGSYENNIRRNTLTAGGFAQGNPDSNSHTFSINAGQNFDLGDGLVTGPTIGWDYTDGTIDAYNETGGGAAALNYLERDYASSITSLGWQISKTKEVSQGILSLQGFASWEHEFSPEAGNVRGSLATSPFAVNGVATGGFGINRSGAAPGTDWLTLGLGARLACHCGLAFSFDYQTQLLRDDVTAHYAGLKVTGAF